MDEGANDMGFITRRIIGRMTNATRGEAGVEGGRKIVSYNRGIRTLAVLFPLLPTGLLYMALGQGAGAPPLVLGIFGSLYLLAGGLIYGALLTRLEFDEYSIYFSSPLYRDRQISWASVTGGGYSAPLTSYWIKTADIGRIWVSPMQHGWVEIVQFAGAKLAEQQGENPFEQVTST